MDAALADGDTRRGGDRPLGLDPIGPEDIVNKYINWYMQKVRGRPSHLQQINDSAALRMALATRSGRNFAEITGEIMADVAAFQKAMLTPAKPAHTTPAKEGDAQTKTSETATPWQHDEPPNRTPRRPGRGKGGKGNKGKGNGKDWKKRQHQDDNKNSSAWKKQSWSFQEWCNWDQSWDNARQSDKQWGGNKQGQAKR